MSARIRRTTGTRDSADCGRCISGLRAHYWQGERRQPQLPCFVRQDLEPLAGFSCSWNARLGAEELRDRFEQIEFNKETYEFRAFTRLKQIRYLNRTKQIDDDFYWR